MASLIKDIIHLIDLCTCNGVWKCARRTPHTYGVVVAQLQPHTKFIDINRSRQYSPARDF